MACDLVPYIQEKVDISSTTEQLTPVQTVRMDKHYHTDGRRVPVTAWRKYPSDNRGVGIILKSRGSLCPAVTYLFPPRVKMF